MNAINMPALWGMGKRTTVASPLRILVVDDDAMVREATAWMLIGAGHTVTEAADGVAALEYLEQQGALDLIITDISMPRMDGFALNDLVQRRWPGLPVLLVSGRPQPPGARAVLMKPFNLKTLLRALADIFDASEPPPYSGL